MKKPRLGFILPASGVEILFRRAQNIRPDGCFEMLQPLKRYQSTWRERQTLTTRLVGVVVEEGDQKEVYDLFSFSLVCSFYLGQCSSTIKTPVYYAFSY